MGRERVVLERLKSFQNRVQTPVQWHLSHTALCLDSFTGLHALLVGHEVVCVAVAASEFELDAFLLRWVVSILQEKDM